MSFLFSNGAATGPPMSWPDPMSYPSLLGITKLKAVTFMGFNDQLCDGKNKESHVLFTHATYGDLIHPMTLSSSVLIDVDQKNKVYLNDFLQCG